MFFFFGHQYYRNVSRDLPQIAPKRSRSASNPKNENSRKPPWGLQLFLRGEADGIRTRNPRIDSPVR